MPIRPDLRHHYEGDDWKNTRARILDRARRGQENIPVCEQCGVPDRWYRTGDTVSPEPFAGASRIVLTVAHLDHDPTNNNLANLAALCQRCHLKYDAKHHRETIRARIIEQQDSEATLFRSQTK